MKSYAFSILTLVTLSATTGCWMLLPGGGGPSTPLQESEISQLTTCDHGDLGKVRKALVLDGYAIRTATGDTVETEYKQTESSPYGRSGRNFLRVSAVRVDEKTIKFRVRSRSESLDKVETGQVRDSYGRVVATDSQLVRNTNEADRSYYAETRYEHSVDRAKICGTPIPPPPPAPSATGH